MRLPSSDDVDQFSRIMQYATDNGPVTRTATGPSAGVNRVVLHPVAAG
jgi:hypothetical protein